MVKIAVLGAGFGGLSAAWHLSQNTTLKADVTVFDDRPLGSGASGVAGGLLHPYAGAKSKKCWAADEGMQAAIELINVAKLSSQQEVARQEGLLRLALTETQAEVYKLASETNSDISWWDPRQCEFYVHHIVLGKPGIFIRSAWSVHCVRYLNGLQAACEKAGVQFKKEHVPALSKLKDYDTVVVAAGHLCRALPELAHLPFSLVKGQSIELQWRRDLFPPPFPLKSDAYLVMNPGGSSCTVGATYEREFDSPEESTEAGKDELIEKVSRFFPRAKELSVIGRKAGARVSTPGHLPALCPIDDRTWIFSGLGSKGLLYHGYMGKLLSEALVKTSTDCIPKELVNGLK